MKRRFLKTGVGLFLMGAIVATLVPSPIDPIHFWIINYILPTITDTTNKIILQIFDWYFLDFSYYLLLFLLAWTMHIKKISTIKIITTIGSIIGVGAAIAILLKVAGVY